MFEKGDYFNSQITLKYFQISYAVLLGVFSYFVLVDLTPLHHANGLTTCEIITWCWVSTLFIEDIRQVNVFLGSPKIRELYHVTNIKNFDFANTITQLTRTFFSASINP